MFFVLMEPWRGRARKVAILLCYVIAIPLEIPIDTVPPVVRESYIAGANVIVQFYVGLTPFLRPLVTLAIACVIALSTLADVYRDVRADGWSQRQRFYRDAPLLPWVRRPMPPQRRS